MGLSHKILTDGSLLGRKFRTSKRFIEIGKVEPFSLQIMTLYIAHLTKFF